MASADPGQLLVNEPEQPTLTPAESRWRALLITLYRIRRLQRVWANLGGFLNTFNASLRERLRASITNNQ
jgi:hypothetical protein